MSKLSFRARQVDYTKSLPIYLNDEIPDVQEYAAINRTVPQMPSGMEKEEETEHHLQRALSAQQVFGISSTDYAIPTPKVEIDNKKYDRIYNVECPIYKTYIRIQPFSSDYEYPDYDCDVEDEKWLESKENLIDLDLFEEIMDRLEKATGHLMNLVSLDEAKMLLKQENNTSLNINDDLLKCIYDYWKEKRLKYRHPLTPTVLTDKSGIQTQDKNPYLVFRRRTEKMQTRKNRKNEEQSYEKMLILKRDLLRAQNILNLIKKRENLKKDLLKITLDSFEKRYKLNDFDSSLYESIQTHLRPSTNQIPSTPTTTTTQQSTLKQQHINENKPQTIANLIQQQQQQQQKSLLINRTSNSQQATTINKLLKAQKAYNEKRLNKSNNLINRSYENIQNKTNTIFKLTQNQQQQQSSLNNKSQLKIRNITQQQLIKRRNSLITDNKTNQIQSNDSIDNNNQTLIKETNELNRIIADDLISEAIINENLNSLSTNIENDGYWCFKRKEGCKYLASNSLLINDNLTNNLIDPQQSKYSYVCSRLNRHLGLVRRRLGRGGRIILDRYDNQNLNTKEESFNFNNKQIFVSKECRKRLHDSDDNDDDDVSDDVDINKETRHDHNLFIYQLEKLNYRLKSMKKYDENHNDSKLLNLNDEYKIELNECYLDIKRVKQAINTLKLTTTTITTTGTNKSQYQKQPQIQQQQQPQLQQQTKLQLNSQPQLDKTISNITNHSNNKIINKLNSNNILNNSKQLTIRKTTSPNSLKISTLNSKHYLLANNEYHHLLLNGTNNTSNGITTSSLPSPSNTTTFKLLNQSNVSTKNLNMEHENINGRNGWSSLSNKTIKTNAKLINSNSTNHTSNSSITSVGTQSSTNLNILKYPLNEQNTTSNLMYI